MSLEVHSAAVQKKKIIPQRVCILLLYLKLDTVYGPFLTTSRSFLLMFIFEDRWYIFLDAWADYMVSMLTISFWMYRCLHPHPSPNLVNGWSRRLFRSHSVSTCDISTQTSTWIYKFTKSNPAEDLQDTFIRLHDFCSSTFQFVPKVNWNLSWKVNKRWLNIAIKRADKEIGPFSYPQSTSMTRHCTFRLR